MVILLLWAYYYLRIIIYNENATREQLLPAAVALSLAQLCTRASVHAATLILLKFGPL